MAQTFLSLLDINKEKQNGFWYDPGPHANYCQQNAHSWIKTFYLQQKNTVYLTNLILSHVDI